MLLPDMHVDLPGNSCCVALPPACPMAPSYLMSKHNSQEGVQ